MTDPIEIPRRAAPSWKICTVENFQLLLLAVGLIFAGAHIAMKYERQLAQEARV